MSAVMPPEHSANDDFLTREEHERFGNLVLGRLQRIEGFLFDDEKDEAGNVKRASLKTFVEKADKHIEVLCSWARGVKIAALTIGSLAGAGYGVIRLIETLHDFGRWPW